MLKHLTRVLLRDCSVVKIGEYTVYPIHRVGFTSLMHAADSIYTNLEIANLHHIDVLIRDPEERFISGVNEYARQNKLDVRDLYNKIQREQFVDTHFMPQFVWLMNLYRFFKGEITIRPFNFISNITKVHIRKGEPHQYLEPIQRFTEVDRQMLRNTTVHKRYYIKDIIKNYQHVLS